MKKILVLTLACLLGLSFVGCSSSTTGKLGKIKSSGVMVVYTDPNFSPFEFSDTGGDVQGVDIEIARAIAAELGVEAKFEEAKFDSIISAIKGGKGDIAISGFTITEERKESVDFSDPYIESVQYLILPQGSDIAVIEDLAGKNVGVAIGYTGQFLMEDEIGEGGVLEDLNTKLSEYNSAMDATLDLNVGRIDAVVMDEYVARNIVSRNPNMGIKAIALSYLNGELAAEEYGVVVPQGNGDLLEVINRVIRRLIAEEKIREWVIIYSE